MPLFKRSRPSPCPSHNAPISLTLFNTSYHLRTSSPTPYHLLHLTSTTASSIHEARHLLALKSPLLHPKDRERMTHILTATETALHEIAQLISPARAPPRPDLPLFDNHSQSSPWLLNDTPPARALLTRLSGCHGSLMSALAVLYLVDIRWMYGAAKPLPPQYNKEVAAPPAYASIPPNTMDQPREKQHHHPCNIWNGPQTHPIPTTPGRCAIDDPHTWQPHPSPPPPEKEQLQSDPTPVGHQCEGFRHRLYVREDVSSAYLEGCRLNEPWSVEFAVPDEGEGDGGDEGGDGGDGDGGLELPPRLSTSVVKRRWSSDVLGGRGL